MAFQVKIHQIRAFVEVARQGSIRGASRMLNMSQPALSKSIQELEEGLAAQLFFRRSKGVTLTDAGESFYQHASLILEELRAAQEEIRQRQGQLAGQINIGMGGQYFPQSDASCHISFSSAASAGKSTHYGRATGVDD